MRRLPRMLFLAVLAFALVAAACGDSGGDTTTTGDTTVEGTTTTSDTTGGTTTTGSTVVACSAPGVDVQLEDVEDHIVETVLADFRAGRHDDGYQANRCYHDWTTDDCSAPGVGSTGVSFDFTHPCHRHDFGYRNYKRIDLLVEGEVWNEVNKRFTDDQFLEDMRDHCATRPYYLKTQCFAWAQTFYLAVRAFG